MKTASLLRMLPAAALALGACSAQTPMETKAPEGGLRVTIHADRGECSQPTLTLMHGADTLMTCTQLGLRTTHRDFGQLRLAGVTEPQTRIEDYVMPTGKRRHCVNTSSDRTYTFVNAAGDSLELQLRVFADGAAFRYVLPSAIEGEGVVDEYTAYRIADGTRRWFQAYEPSYERMFPLATDGSDVWKRQNHKWGYPGLLEPCDSLYVLVTESDITRGHAASLLSNAADPETYRIVNGDSLQTARAGWSTPWRVLIAGDLATVVESTLVTDVATPSQAAGPTDWIQPGPVSWIYWAYNHGSNDLEIIKRYIDLAREMRWPYMLIDAEWDEMLGGHSVEEAFEYARASGVRPMIWYNSTTGWIDGAPGPKWRLNERSDRLKEYEWLRSAGVAGVKIDFFGGDDVATMDYTMDLLEDALDQGLTVTLHGATVPRGWQRTYPNLMTTEGVYGAEWYNNNDYLTERAACHNATLPYTRNVIGSMDYTPGTFSDSQHPHITSHAHELALTILFESAMQHMPDRPEAYLSLPAEVRDLLSTLPTVWDDTRLLGGYPGESAVMARRSGDTWYIAGINGTDSPATLTADLRRLALGQSQVTVISDGEQERSFAPVVTRPLEGAALEVPCRGRGGFVAVVRPVRAASGR